MSAPLHTGSALQTAAAQAARRSAQHLAALQDSDGHWRGALTDPGPTVAAEYVLFAHSRHPFPSRDRIDAAIRHILDSAPACLDASVKAYAALKLAGLPAGDPHMAALRSRALELGGLQSAADATRLALGVFGLCPAARVDGLPSSLAMPITVLRASPPRSTGISIDELRAPGVPDPAPPRPGLLDRLRRSFGSGGGEARARAWLAGRRRAADSYIAAILSAMALDDPGDPTDRLWTDGALQPAITDVWDTALCALAATETARSSAWLASRQLRPAGWSFDAAADSPRVDATALVLQTLRNPEALEWLLANQSGDGAWESSPDVTGLALDALAAHGHTRGHAAVDRAVDWLVAHQEPDGSWRGRWGVAYIYGTCFALRGLAAAGENDREAHVLRAGEWLRSIQNAGGGWGESPASYDNGVFTPGPSTPSQTAWAILGLIAGGDPASLSVHHGVEHLLATQRPDGTWDEQIPTVTAIPQALYLRHSLYKDAFPLLALDAFAKARLDV